MNPEIIKQLYANAGASQPQGFGQGGRARFVNGQFVLDDDEEPKTQGRGGWLTSLISELSGAGGATAGAATGAALGSVVPGIGTIAGGVLGGVAGGFLGGTGGRAVENKVRDDEYRLSQALQEGALSGAFGGLGGAFQGAKAAKAIKNVGALDDVVKQALGFADDFGKAGVGASKSQIKNAIKLGKDGILSGADAGLAKSVGIKQGAKVSGKEILPTDAKTLIDFAKKGSSKYTAGGVKFTTPQAIANSADDAFRNVSTSLDDALNVLNRDLTKTQKNAMIKSIKEGIAKNKNITAESAKTANKFIDDISKNVKDVRGLEMLRREADDIIFTNSGVAGRAAKASEGQVVRGVIDDFVTNLGGDDITRQAAQAYKSIKGDYGVAKRLAELTSKNAGSAKGLPVPFLQGLNAPVTGGATRLRAARSAIGDASLSSALSAARPLAAGSVARSVGNQFLPSEEMPEGELLQAQAPQTGMAQGGVLGAQAPASSLASELSGGFDTQSFLQQATMRAISESPTTEALQENLGTISLLAEVLSSINPQAQSGLNIGTLSFKDYSNAQQGYDAVNQLEQLITSDPNVIGRTATPGRGLPLVGGYISNATDTAGYDALGYNIADSILRIRTGAQANESEIKNLQSQLMPRAGDSPEVIQNKLALIRANFEPALEIAGAY